MRFSLSLKSLPLRTACTRISRGQREDHVGSIMEGEDTPGIISQFLNWILDPQNLENKQNQLGWALSGSKLPCGHLRLILCRPPARPIDIAPQCIKLQLYRLRDWCLCAAATYFNCSCSSTPLWRRYFNSIAGENPEATTEEETHRTFACYAASQNTWCKRSFTIRSGGRTDTLWICNKGKNTL